MEITMRRVTDLTPYGKNAKKHDAKQIANVANSIKRFGWQQPLVIDENGVVVIGHGRLLAAKKLGLAEVPCTVASGLTDEEIRELRVADNKTNESPWDMELLEDEIQGLDFEGFEFDFMGGSEEAEEELYTRKTKIPQYEPTGEMPELSALYDKEKADMLIAEIDLADIPEDVRMFLRLAAMRHVVFNYRRIAEYYCNAEPEVQRLMERSALVLIDIDDAIANGYTKLTADIEEMLQEAEDA